MALGSSPMERDWNLPNMKRLARDKLLGAATCPWTQAARFMIIMDLGKSQPQSADSRHEKCGVGCYIQNRHLLLGGSHVREKRARPLQYHPCPRVSPSCETGTAVSRPSTSQSPGHPYGGGRYHRVLCGCRIASLADIAQVVYPTTKFSRSRRFDDRKAKTVCTGCIYYSGPV